MRITKLLLWVQENKLSERFYKKLGFDVLQSNEEHSLVSLNGFTLDLVSMRDEDEFTRDSMSTDKGEGVYVYISVKTGHTMITSLAANHMAAEQLFITNKSPCG